MIATHEEFIKTNNALRDAGLNAVRERMELGESCALCRFYKDECRRHAPSVIDQSFISPDHGRVVETIASWPPVQPTDWCGDFERKTTG